MHRALMTSVLIVLMLGGCSTMYVHGFRDHPWRLTRVQGETDYELLDEVLFAIDSTELSPHAQQVIADLALEVRHDTNVTIMVEGYTDTAGNPQHNLELSRIRAGAVAEALAHNGVDHSQIHTHGFGETRLAVPTLDQTQERRNRRVVIRVLSPA